MLKIGDFARLGRVSVRTLHHYARLGLIGPAWVDRYSGYRYYAAEQLPRLNRILALKDLGFTLDEVRQCLRDDLSAAQLRAMLFRKRTELALEVAERQARLARVEARLAEIEAEGQVTAAQLIASEEREKMELKIVDRPAFAAIGMQYHGRNQNGEITQMWGVFNQRFLEIAPLRAGGCYGICAMPDTNGEFSYLAAIEVNKDIAAIPAGYVRWDIPAARYAVFTHRGPLSGMGETWQRIMNEWLPAAGYRHANTFDFEVYDERFNPMDPDHGELDIYVPLEKIKG